MDSVDSVINIKVKGNAGEVFFKMKGTTLMNKLMEAWAARTNSSVEAHRFLFNGDKVKPEDTPASLGLEEGDIIDVMIESL